MFKTRLISGIIVAVTMLGLTWLGGIYLSAALLIAALIGSFEFYRATGVLPEGRKISPNTGISYCFTVIYYCFLTFAKDKLFWLIFVTVVFLLVLLALYVFSYPVYVAKDIIFTFFGYFYVSVMISFLYLTRSLEDGIFIVILVFTSSWLCDVFAYFTGMLIGKHRLCPNLSPKKSIEGAIGGIVFPAIIAGLYGLVISRWYSPDYPLVASCVVLTAVGAAVSMLGDLSASAIKRNYEIKDYGTLIPGHGGILDRFDSMIFTAPMIYFTAVLIAGM